MGAIPWLVQYVPQSSSVPPITCSVSELELQGTWLMGDSGLEQDCVH